MWLARIHSAWFVVGHCLSLACTTHAAKNKREEEIVTMASRTWDAPIPKYQSIEKRLLFLPTRHGKVGTIDLHVGAQICILGRQMRLMQVCTTCVWRRGCSKWCNGDTHNIKTNITLQLWDRSDRRNSSLQAVCNTLIARIAGCVSSLRI